MQVGMIGLGRMGANMTRRLMQAGHACVVYDSIPDRVKTLSAEGAAGAFSIEELVASLQPPRVVWLMLPAAIIGPVLDAMLPLLAPSDVVVDGGNSDPAEAPARARQLGARGIGFVDVGTSGGVWGLREGYCLMIGGDVDSVARLQPLFEALAPAPQGQPASRGYLHCGPSGAGHFVKMVHNGIEYGLMAAYAEGFNLLVHAGRGARKRSADAETAPPGEADVATYEFDVHAIAELWRHGSVVRSWLLDLTASALRQDPRLERFAGRVGDSGEGRWALKAAIDLSVPAPVLASALFGRFGSRAENAYADRVLSAMREQFGGHTEEPATPEGSGSGEAVSG